MKNWVGLRCFWTAITTLASFGHPGAIGNLETLAKQATRSVTSAFKSNKVWAFLSLKLIVSFGHNEAIGDLETLAKRAARSAASFSNYSFEHKDIF